MKKLKLYEVNSRYIEYLASFESCLFHNSKDNQRNSRKYIGIVLIVNNREYFAPLSSFKEKYRKMKETVDFIKVKKYAVISLNNMVPVPKTEYSYVNFADVVDLKYKSLLQSEYRFIKSIQDRICKHAQIVYKHKLEKENSTSLGRRCNNFKKLEIAYQRWIESTLA